MDWERNPEGRATAVKIIIKFPIILDVVDPRTIHQTISFDKHLIIAVPMDAVEFVDGKESERFEDCVGCVHFTPEILEQQCQHDPKTWNVETCYLGSTGGATK